MPYIDVQIASENVESEVARKIAAGVTDVMANVLNKKRHLVAVTVSPIHPEHWFIADQSVVDQGHRTTAFVTARITGGSNTEEQKAKALEDLHLLLSNAIGALHEASYIVLQELPASDWGYSGQSQQSRNPALKRLENGALDTKHYQQKGRRLQSTAMRVALRGWVRGIWDVWGKRGRRQEAVSSIK